MFNSNLHTIDRAFRLVIGLFIVSLAFWGPKTPFAYIGIILIITALINFCPLYAIVGFSSQPKDPK